MFYIFIFCHICPRVLLFTNVKLITCMLRRVVFVVVVVVVVVVCMCVCVCSDILYKCK